MARLNTIVSEQCDQIAADEQKAAALEAEISELKEQLQPPPFQPPLEQARISSGTGYRMDPMGGGTEGLHKGVDLVGPIGAPVMAVLDGVVAEHWLVPGWHYGKQYHGHAIFGGYIVLDHGDGLFSAYGHLSKTFIHEGESIEMGQTIGLLGSTGISTGSHLHFEIITDGLKYLERRR